MSDAEARRRIEEELDATFAVEAAAGTGKTTSLVARLVALVGAGCDIGKIVAVTFTDRAAAELKLRVRIVLERRKQQATGERSRQYEHALLRLEESNISTIHRFAGDLLRRRPIESGVDPQFSPMSPGESRALLEEAFGRWLDVAITHPPPTLDRALHRHGGGIDKLKRSVVRLVEHRHLTHPWTRLDLDVGQEARAAAQTVQKVAQDSRSAGSRTDRLYLALRKVRELADRIERERMEDSRLEAELVERARGPWDRFAGYGNYGAGVDRTALIEDATRMRAQLDSFSRRASAHLAVELRDELAGAMTIYEELKARRAALDFDDLLIRARDVLLADPALLADTRRSMTHFLVDEFQDTDPIQAALLLILTSEEEAPKEPFATRIAKGKLFVVGDPKQSIYRFRHADPGTYEIVRRLVVESGGSILELGRSFRSVPSILQFVNTAFGTVMTADSRSQQTGYVPLEPSREETPDTPPAIIALPITKPYGKRRLARGSIREHFPPMIARLVSWLLNESGRTVLDPVSRTEVPIAARHIAILFRQFESYGKSTTAAVSRALTEFLVPHVVVGASALGEREEMHALFNALNAIERPDDALYVYATLRGLLFGLNDETLFEWRHRYGTIRATGLPCTAIPETLSGVLEALLILGELHRLRNARPPAETIAALLRATRAQVGFALSPSAEQAFLQMAALDRVAFTHERSGGLSFRSFVDELSSIEGDRSVGYEDVSDEAGGGLRIMTVHRAKGLEFPVVILADPAETTGREPDKYVDVAKNLGALSLMGCAPWDLLEAHDVELDRNRAEGARVAYVAATRARDILVIPVVGDDATFPQDGWISPLAATLQSPQGYRPLGPDLVANRPDDVDRPTRALAAGIHPTRGGTVQFMDPRDLVQTSRRAMGFSDTDLLQAGDPTAEAQDLAAWQEHDARRIAAIATAASSGRWIETVTALSKGATPIASTGRMIDKLRGSRQAGRPTGKQFGTLVHMVLATVAVDDAMDTISATSQSVGRLTGASEKEMEAAAVAVKSALEHRVFSEVRSALAAGRLVQREVPVTYAVPTDAPGARSVIADGIVDLVYDAGDVLWVVDYKTDDADTMIEERLTAYETQVGLYCSAIEAALKRDTRGALLFI